MKKRMIAVILVVLVISAISLTTAMAQQAVNTQAELCS
jgi:hypothetical protein